MAIPGRVEINLVRLLTRCEAMASDVARTDHQSTDWRLDKYITTLHDYLGQLRKLTANCPSPDLLADYTRRVDLLRGILEAEKLPTASEKSHAVDLLVPSKQTTSASAGSRELHAQTKSRYQTEMRVELLGQVDHVGDLRQRKKAVDGDVKSTPEEDVDTLLRHHHDMQEKIAEEMLHYAHSLKENARAAGRVVKQDNQKLVDTSRIADSNFGKLKIESDRLELHVASSCNWWIWILLFMVIATFIWMVVFMKMFPKK